MVNVFLNNVILLMHYCKKKKLKKCMNYTASDIITTVKI